MAITRAAASQLRDHDVRTRYLRLDRPDHSGCECRRGVLHRRLAARAYRQDPRASVGRCGEGGGLDHADLRVRAVAGGADLGLCRRPRAATTGDGAMIVVLLNVYLVLLFLLVKLHIVRFNLFWKVSPFMVLFLLLIGLFIPMGWGAPQGSAVVVRNSVAIVPDVAGAVIEVPVTANAPLKSGDVLFRIDPT